MPSIFSRDTNDRPLPGLFPATTFQTLSLWGSTLVDYADCGHLWIDGMAMASPPGLHLVQLAPERFIAVVPTNFSAYP